MISGKGLYTIINYDEDESGLYNDEKIASYNVKLPSSYMNEEQIEEYITKGNWKTYKI